jgi:hypothetical protein
VVQPPILAFIDCDIASGMDEFAREALLLNVQRYRADGVAPLFVSWLRERADLRIVCLVRNLGDFNDFMLDVVRCVAGVRETRTTLSFGGVANLEALLELEMEVNPTSSTLAASVWIDVKPGQDRACFEALRHLPHHPDVRQVWLLNCHHSEESDLMLLLLGKNYAALSAYVMSWVRTAPGVLDTQLSTIQDWRWLAGADEIIEMCDHFFLTNAGRTAHTGTAAATAPQQDEPFARQSIMKTSR